MTMKFSIIGFIAFFLAACSSNVKQEGEKLAELNETAFLGGGITVIYDEDGDFQAIACDPAATNKVTHQSKLLRNLRTLHKSEDVFF